tara:strand:- start:3554 stop:4651 length:1098 start_codon:yes stop_codon:yes gene_type:complete
MKKVNFFLNQMAFCKTYVPLIDECVKRGIAVDVFVEPSGKYNCPMHENNLKQLVGLSKMYNFNLRDFKNEGKDAKGLMFVSGRYLVKDPVNKRWNGEEAWKNEEVVWKYHDYLDMNNLHVVVITNCVDFENTNFGHVRYKKIVDNIIFISKKYAEEYKTFSDKNLYFGSPKYDFHLTRSQVVEKYKSVFDHSEKYCLLVLPKLRDLRGSYDHLSKAVSNMRKLGYKIIGKSRAKDSYRGLPALPSLCDVYFEDVTWFTHPTMDFIVLSDIVINCNSTAIEEAVMLKTPVINFVVKQGNTYLNFLYDNAYCKQYDIKDDFSDESFVESFKYLTSKDLSIEFDRVIEKMMFKGNSSKKILDYFKDKI